MSVLFLQGYILCDPQGSPLDVDVAAPALASRQGTMQRSKLGPKTITQIAMEQCNDMMKVDVCGKTMMLWGKTSREDALAAMSEMKGVVRDMIGRLDVDFCENSLYLCLECFDLESWQAERQSATGRERLHRKSRLLCEVFRVVWTPSLWSLAVEVAMKQRRLFGDSQKPLHANRAAWAMALAESLASAPPQGVIVGEFPAGVDGAACVAVVGFQTAISFYLSVRDGTPDVEQLFARLKEIGHEHGDLQYAEACLELIKEGPQREDEMFEQRPSGPLLMTPFTRRCAELWQARWGKRFTVQKTRLDVGKRRIGNGVQKLRKLFVQRSEFFRKFVGLYVDFAHLFDHCGTLLLARFWNLLRDFVLLRSDCFHLAFERSHATVELQNSVDVERDIFCRRRVANGIGVLAKCFEVDHIGETRDDE